MQKSNIAPSRLWVCILLSFSLTVLTYSLTHYLVCAVHTFDSCRFLCPSYLSKSTIIFPLFLEKWFALQSWLLIANQNLLGIGGSHKNLILSSLILAPLIEESMYRGPLYLLKRHIGFRTWLFLAGFLCVIFVISHKLSGLSMLPLVVLGLASSWLIMKTERFWPSLALHFLYNFQVVSLPFYQSFLWADWIDRSLIDTLRLVGFSINHHFREENRLLIDRDI
jgi:membrane protease YdiL (CAAX protease family)